MRFSIRDILWLTVVVALGQCQCSVLGQTEPLDELVKDVRLGNVKQSASAALSLGKHYGRSAFAIEVLVDALADTRESVESPAFAFGPRQTVAAVAAEALRIVGEPAVAPLDRLVDSDRALEVRLRAMQVLAEMRHGSLEAVPSLERCLKDDAYEIRMRATETLELVQPDRRRLIVSLTPVLADRSPHVRAAAARALGNLGELAADAVPSLVGMLDDMEDRWHWYSPHAVGTRPVRFDAAEALGRIGSPAPDAVEKLGAMMRKDEAEIVQVAAALAFCRLAKDPSPGLEVLANRIVQGGEWSDFPVEAAIGLRDLGAVARPTMPALVEALRHPHTLVRIYAAEAIATIDPANAAKWLVPLLKDENRMVREGAIESLVKLRVATDDTIAAYIAALDDVDEVFSDSVRRAAAEALGHLGPRARSAIPRLKALEKEDEDPRVRNAAKIALSRIER